MYPTPCTAFLNLAPLPAAHAQVSDGLFRKQPARECSTLPCLPRQWLTIASADGAILSASNFGLTAAEAKIDLK